MSREIKFDLIYKGETGFHHKKYFLETLMCGIKSICDIHEMMELIATRQYTGLKDQNGAEIYEGDILQTPYSYDGSIFTDYEGDEGHYRGLVHYQPSKGFLQTSCLVLSNSDADQKWRKRGRLDIRQSYCLVIGNIHENPELLEVKS